MARLLKYNKFQLESKNKNDDDYKKYDDENLKRNENKLIAKTKEMKSFLNEKSFKNDYQRKKLKILYSIESHLKVLANSKKEEENIEDSRKKFIFAAMVLDRLFFWLSILYFILTFSILVLSTENFYKLRG